MNWKEMTKLVKPTQEDWFDIWAQELIEAGYIDELVSPPDVPTFRLFDGLSKPYGKRKNSIMGATSYTPDRIIKWNIKAKGIFFTPFDGDNKDWDSAYFKPHFRSLGELPSDKESGKGFYYSIIDVKGPTGSTRLNGTSFMFTQKWLWANTKQFVQKVMLAPNKPKKNELPYLWATTFTPKRFMYTDGLSTNRNKPVPTRAIPSYRGEQNWVPRTLETFIKTRTLN